ncbi:Peptidoglycan-binding (PGRP) domain of peptidoglycan hydrolases-containing protein [Actinacidiphila yanglinensis]|uniref:Peptidoglycan-binding (PGRP) domain of peptidoglycan hydrolases-containing protein n=1 Tax=Actinacidiphila yanglinensis TaxID=310779 RepID=A0A1H6B969_9ACTN|nr:peptidoglycan-binding protein [Actinacidiphila yanglinensis]SEG57383.1 Peptidoglycan-binding (PGRP) domain of peptidoglycan hydrolases-containing protein [Actinacidiphila yanglinensis]
MSLKRRSAMFVAAAAAVLVAMAPTAANAAPHTAAASAVVTPNSSVNGSISASEILSRAASWNGTPYSTTAYKYGPGGDIAYRTDCSGYVSMALHLSSSLTTVSLPSVVHSISKAGLQPGDLIGVLGAGTSGNAGHVLLFDSWADSGHTQYYAWEDSGDAGVHHLTMPYPYWPNTSGPSPSLYQPYRYNNESGSTGGGVPPWPNVVEGNTGTNVEAAQYLLDDHGASVATDGQFGADTLAATKAYQSAHGLGVDGQVGPQTWSSLIVQIQEGSSGDAVKAAQLELNKYGYGLSVDGQFGAGTESAARAFQSSHGLGVDGQIGPQTWETLVGD